MSPAWAWIDNVLVLKDGAVLAQGAREEILRGPVLSEAFGLPCLVEKTREAYTLHIVCAPHG